MSCSICEDFVVHICVLDRHRVILPDAINHHTEPCNQGNSNAGCDTSQHTAQIHLSAFTDPRNYSGNWTLRFWRLYRHRTENVLVCLRVRAKGNAVFWLVQLIVVPDGVAALPVCTQLSNAVVAVSKTFWSCWYCVHFSFSEPVREKGALYIQHCFWAVVWLLRNCDGVSNSETNSRDMVSVQWVFTVTGRRKRKKACI